jgi:hypothetical protein
MVPHFYTLRTFQLFSINRYLIIGFNYPASPTARTYRRKKKARICSAKTLPTSEENIGANSYGTAAFE